MTSNFVYNYFILILCVFVVSFYLIGAISFYLIASFNHLDYSSLFAYDSNWLYFFRLRSDYFPIISDCGLFPDYHPVVSIITSFDRNFYIPIESLVFGTFSLIIFVSAYSSNLVVWYFHCFCLIEVVFAILFPLVLFIFYPILIVYNVIPLYLMDSYSSTIKYIFLLY